MDDVIICCTICHRNGTPDFELIVDQLQPLNSYVGRIVHRTFGDRLGMVAGSLVCTICDAYVCPRRKNDERGSWSVAWPAVIWTCLSVNNFAHTEKFMQFFSASLRRAWSASMPLWNANILANFDVRPTFRDVTRDIDDFNRDIDSGEMGRIRRRINETCYPSVRCPQVCFKFIDDLRRNRLQLIPALHYVATFCTGFQSFNADPSLLKGARPDWTQLLTDMDRLISPCIVINEKGICLLACSEDTHSSASLQWLHVPTNPVFGNRPPLVPDLQAPVVLSGNCLRPGKTNQMNTSYPVYEQTGSTTGLSTFRLTSRFPHFQMTDEIALGMGLVYENRPDILHLSKQSPALSDGIDDIVQFYSTHRHGRPYINVERHYLAASYIQLEDAHIIAQAYNTRLTRVDAPYLHIDGERPTLLREPRDIFAVVHSTNDRGHGAFVMDTKQYSDSNDENRQRTLGKIAFSVLSSILCCSHIYEALLNSKWRTDNALRDVHKDIVTALKLLVKADQSPHFPLTSTIRVHLRQTNLRQAEDGTAQFRIASALTSICAGIHHFDNMSLDEILQRTNDLPNNIVVVSSVARRPLGGFPEVLGDLTAMLGLSARQDLAVTWRWTRNTSWQYSGTCEHGTDFGQHDMMIYVKNHRSDLMQKSLQSLCNGQSIIRCILHEYSLIREQRGMSIECVVHGCVGKIQWRCSNGLGHHQCAVGVCRKHFNQFVTDKNHNLHDKPYMIGEYGPRRENDLRLPQRRGLVPEDEQNEEGAADQDVVDDPFEIFLQGDGNEPESIIDEATLEDNDCGFVPCPTTTSILKRPIFSSDASTSSAGHYLLNHHLRVMSRTAVMKKPPISTLKFLQNLCAKQPHGRVSLLYPEAMLFPRIFWCTVNESVVGALPSVLYNNVVDSIVLKDVASVNDHFIVRLQDETLMTAHDHSYIQFAFDVLLNRDLNRNSAVIACNRGLEAVVRDGARFYPEAEEHILKFDEVDAEREVNRLLAMMRTEGPWNYFITLTCNESRTFGLAPLHIAIERLAFEQGKDLSVLLQNYSVLLTRAWERTVHYTWNYITTSAEQPLGHVKSSWMRYEFQSG